MAGETLKVTPDLTENEEESVSESTAAITSHGVNSNDTVNSAGLTPVQSNDSEPSRETVKDENNNNSSGQTVINVQEKESQEADEVNTPEINVPEPDKLDPSDTKSSEPDTSISTYSQIILTLTYWKQKHSVASLCELVDWLGSCSLFQIKILSNHNKNRCNCFKSIFWLNFSNLFGSLVP